MPKKKNHSFSETDGFWEAREATRRSDWKKVMDSVEGRRVLTEIMWDFAHVDLPSATYADPQGQAYNEGGRAVGLSIKNTIKTIDIDIFCSMMKFKHQDDEVVAEREAFEAEREKAKADNPNQPENHEDKDDA